MLPGRVQSSTMREFEAGKGHVGKGGVVRDPEVHARVLRDVLTAAQAEGYAVRGLTVSPLKGPAGNVEFLAWLSVNASEKADLDTLIASAITRVTEAPDA